MKKILLLFLITSICFSQNTENSIFQIDSIVNNITPHIQSSGIIKNKKNKIIGGFNITEYNNGKSNTIKVLYNENIKSINSYYYDAEIYFNQNQPFYIILSVKRKGKNNATETIKFELNKSELETDKEIKNIFLLNIKLKIKSILSQIIIDK